MARANYKRRFAIAPAMIWRLVLGGWLSVTSVTPLLAASTGSIKGRVLLVGEVTQPRPVEIPDKYIEKCGAKKVVETLAVSPDHGIKNAVVSLLDVKQKVIRPGKNLTLDQTACVFTPHVLIVPVGASVEILNNDGILHNIHAHSSKNPVFNKAQPGSVKKITTSFSEPEIIKVTCDVHPWMLGWIVVTDLAQATATNDGGTFSLTQVPAGIHTLEVWHETLGTTKKKILVEAGKETNITIELRKR